MKKKIAVGACILAVLLVAGGLWYTRPQSFWAVTGLDPGRISGVSGHATELSVEHGRARTTSWTMDHRGPGDEDYEALIALLERGSYRAKLSNLTAPFSDSQPGSERWVQLSFAADGELFSVQIPVSQTMTIPIPDSYGYLRYDASNPQFQGELFQYIQANGEKL